MKLPVPRYLALLFFVHLGLALMPPVLGAKPEKVPGPKWEVLEEKMRQDGEGLSVKAHPGARRAIDLNGRFTHVSAMVRGENGQLQQRCFNTYAAMDNALRGKAVPQEEPEQKNEVAEK